MNLKRDHTEVTGWARGKHGSPADEVDDIISNTATRIRGSVVVGESGIKDRNKNIMPKSRSASIKGGKKGRKGTGKTGARSTASSTKIAANRKLSSHASSRGASKGRPVPRGVGKQKGGGAAGKRSMGRRSLASSSRSQKSKKSAKSVKSGAASKKSKKSARSGKSSKGSRGIAGGRRGAGRSGKSHGGGRRGRMTFTASMELLEERYFQGRNAIIAEEEFELHNYSPLYNVLMLEIVHSQVEEISRRQRHLTDAVRALREEGIPVADDDTVEQITEKLRQKLHSDTETDMQNLRDENTALRDRLENRALELEKKVGEVEILRNTIARKLAKVEVDNEAMRAKVQRVIQSANLDVERMKKELTHRIEICCAAIRTPKYGTALRSMQDLVAQVQHEIQEHRDVLCKLVVSIGAKDTFKRSPDESETMHSNFPTQYRSDLRKLNKDHLLNVLDVLSFQDGVVETVGKALFVLNETEYQTSVV